MNILIVGAGIVGFNLAQELSNEGHDISIIDADAEKIKLISEKLDVLAIRGNGDARATKISADAYNRDREFYAFMRSMQAYKNSLQTGTTVLLSEKSDFLRYLNKSR